MPICEYASMPFTFLHPPAMDIRIFESSVLSAVTGIKYSVDRLWETGDRIYTLRRAAAVMRENRSREQDDLSQVWFERRAGAESLAEPLDRTKWEALKNRFYVARGWNPANGRPTRSKLERLGMKGVADKLQSAGRLG